MTDLLIIGGGTAGLTAALYALRAGLSVQVLEKETFGGQIAFAPKVENYPGLPGISGAALADALLAQAMEQGAEIELETVTGLRVEPEGFAVLTGGKAYESRSVIVATGARHRALGLPDENAWLAKGLSYCAVCDGAFHKGQAVAVVGGGGSASQAALFLSGLCESVTLIHRREGFRCAPAELEALRARPNVRFELNAQVRALRGADALTAVELEDVNTGATRELPAQALFVCIGQEPDNAAFAGTLPLDDDGFFIAGEDCLTSVPGVFVAGDCRAKQVRQLTTAAADGAVAALAAQRYLQTPHY